MFEPRIFKSIAFCLVALIAVLILCSCAGGGSAPVKNLSYSTWSDTPSSGDLPAEHIVVKGDTLYSIAWRYGIDFRELAKLNDIDNRYTIYPGKTIRLTALNGDVNQTPQPTNVVQINRERLKQAVRGALGLKPETSSSVERVASSKNISKQPVQNLSKRGNLTRKRASRSRSKTVIRTKGASSTSAGQQKAVSVSRWLWPTRGKILDGFSSELHGNKGLDISGTLGQPVKAAAPGRVVYRGNALKGYGNLIIVKHNDDFLSAYAHNAKIYVKENEVVKAGQVIADIGSSGTDRNKLHFEIRYRGKPVNPMKYLPKL